ncbi:hypothetical protein [Aureibacillus halotolerans]|uniref:Uncharacterized protein n=1 Tax=Aureibacillus halotolerans TaxID=1508390 RepID=A0A4R6U2A8_9BACI|nr:hypothetical protein [Aureibacillus halotolerans]TDQ39776.1 hypothetical protein EV213_107143 [Aureibacillus halotolerans]
MDHPMKNLEKMLSARAGKTEKWLEQLADEVENKDDLFTQFADKASNEIGVHASDFFQRRHSHQLDGLEHVLESIRSTKTK